MNANENRASDTEERARRALHNYIRYGGQMNDHTKYAAHENCPYCKADYFSELEAMYRRIALINHTLAAHPMHLADFDRGTGIFEAPRRPQLVRVFI